MRKLPLYRRVLFTVLTILMVWLSAELLLGITGWYRTPSERYYTDIFKVVHELRPDVTLTFSNANVPLDPTNHAGFRGPEFTDAKPTGTYRIIAVGDSTTFGVTVAEKETYARQLERMLREKEKQPIEVLNAGLPGTNIYAHRLLLKEKLVRFQPNLLILYVLFNAREEIEAFRRIEHRTSEKTDPVVVAHRILSKSLLYRFLRKIIKGGEREDIESHFEAIIRYLNQPNTNADQWVKEGFEEDLETFAAVAREHGIQVMLVHHIHRALVNIQAERLSDTGLPTNDMERTSLYYRRITEAFCNRNQLVCPDILPAFRDAARAGTKLFNDDVHFSAEGHRLMAGLLAEAILENADKLGLQTQ